MYSLIVVDYNALDTTIEYVRRCYDCLGMEGAGHTVIVENGSSEGTLESMRLRFGEPDELQLPDIPVALYLYRNAEQQICYCNSGANLGYAKGNNLGIHIAQTLWQDFGYIISNNDLVFDNDLEIFCNCDPCKRSFWGIDCDWCNGAYDDPGDFKYCGSN